MHELTEMLPVGMVANGGLVAEIMAEIAQRQRNLPGWEAFHYEKISESAVELTGGLVSINHGNKRWLEPHDCITIPLAAVILEMQKRGLCESTPEPSKSSSSEHYVPLSNASKANPPSQILHVCFALPDEPEARLRVLQAYHLDADILGARVLACHFGNETNKN